MFKTSWIMTLIALIFALLLSCSSVPIRPNCAKISLDNKDEAIIELLNCNENLNIYIDHFVK